MAGRSAALLLTRQRLFKKIIFQMRAWEWMFESSKVEERDSLFLNLLTFKRTIMSMSDYVFFFREEFNRYH